MSCSSTNKARLSLLRAAARLAVHDCLFFPLLACESLGQCQNRVRAYLSRNQQTRYARFRVRRAGAGVIVTKLPTLRFAARGEVQRLLRFPLSAREKKILFRWRWNRLHS